MSIFSQWTTNNNDQWRSEEVSAIDYQWQPAEFTSTIYKKWFSNSIIYDYESNNNLYKWFSNSIIYDYETNKKLYKFMSKLIKQNY